MATAKKREHGRQINGSTSVGPVHNAKRARFLASEEDGLAENRTGTGSMARSHRVVQTNGTGGSHSNQQPSMTDAVEVERSQLLAEKSRSLGVISDRHDDLVREMFHMQNFVTMVAYNPVEAKADDSAVFNEFKSKFDLLNNAPASGPTRQTRRSANERRQILVKAPAISAPARMSSSVKKGKAKANTSEDVMSIISSTKPSKKPPGKDGHPTSVEQPPRAGPSESNADTSVTGSVAPEVADAFAANGDAIHARRKSISKTHTTSSSRLPHNPSESISTAAVERIGTKSRHRDTSPPLSPAKTLSSLSCQTPVLLKENVHPPKHSEDLPFGLNRRSIRLKDTGPPISPSKPLTLKVRPLKEVPSIGMSFSSQASEPVSIPPSSPSKLAIKRIKLIVRRPPRQLTNPKQRPPEPKFGSSIDGLLSSYTCLNEDGEDMHLSLLQEQAFEEAKLREHAHGLRREGRFAPRQDVESEEDEETVDAVEAEHVAPQRTSKDLWDVVIDDVIARYKKRRGGTLAKRVTSSVASKIQVHFDAIDAKKTKAREAEERKLRALAKGTMKMVLAEWKKAVFHIRERHRQEAEEEERRLGHEHLDAILNQSGQLLETQQEDLSRANLSRSQSASTLGVEDDQEETDEDEDGDEEESDEDEEEGDENGREHDEEMSEVPPETDLEREAEGFEEGTSAMLLGDELPTKSSTRSATPTTIASSGVEEENDDDDDDDDVVSRTFASPAPSLRDLINPPDSSPMGPPPPQNIDLGRSTTPATVDDDDMRGNQTPLTSEAGGTPSFTPASAQQAVEPDRSRSAHNTPSDENTWKQKQIVDSEPVFSEEVEPEVNDEPPPMSIDMDGSGEIAGDEEGGDSLQAPDQTDPGYPEEDPIEMPEYLKPYAVAPVRWVLEKKLTQPLLLRGTLRPYQHSGMEWLASLHTNKLNGILADEMGLGKTIQTIALLAHLACDLGIWGPHLIVVPTSVLLNWEMEFKKFLPGFRILSYHGTTKRRKELRQGWNDKHHFNVCVTSYALASRDAHIFKRKSWYYMILDEAHMIKNFKSQRWNILLMFRSYRRLLLTGTPLQNNLTELWALLQFLMSGSNFANLKEFGEWFSNPLEKAIEMGQTQDEDTLQRVSKLHTVLRPYLLRRLKRDVEKELPSKFDHLVLCPLSKRQRFLYDEFMSRAHTRDALQSGIYQKIANILMQLRKVCNHPDLFEVRPIVTSFVMTPSAVADYEIKEFLIRRHLLQEQEESVDMSAVGLQFVHRQDTPLLAAVETRRLDATEQLPFFGEDPGEPPPRDTRTISGFRTYSAYFERAKIITRWAHTAYLNRIRCSRLPIYSSECLSTVAKMSTRILPYDYLDERTEYLNLVTLVNKAVKSHSSRAKDLSPLVESFTFATPPAITRDVPRIALAGVADIIRQQPLDFDNPIHLAAVKLQIAFPQASLLQYDCGKLQKLSSLLREKKAGGHRVLIFTQMTRILDILETFLNFHGYLYLRLDGATKIEDRQYITERFNADSRIFCFISSSRSGGVGINLTGADTVVFYDSDFNPQMDRQCEDRAHRIGQIRDVHIYRFVSQFTVEEAMLRKANQKRSLNDLVIQRGEFDWRSLFNDEATSALTKALGDFEDTEDRIAAAAAVREERSLVGADEDDFDDLENLDAGLDAHPQVDEPDIDQIDEEQPEDGGTVVEYMVSWVEQDWEYFADWRI